MSRSRSHSFTVTFRVVVVLPDVVDMPGSALSEQNLADPDKSVDAAMDDLLPRDASPEILRQAQVATRPETPGRGAGGGEDRVRQIALIPSAHLIKLPNQDVPSHGQIPLQIFCGVQLQISIRSTSSRLISSCRRS